MAKDRANERAIEKYIATLLETYFGENDANITADIAKPFVVIRLQNFLPPSEKVLLKKQEFKHVAETRDLLINGLKPEILKELGTLIEEVAIELYADWNFENKSGLLIAIMKEEDKTKRPALKWPIETEREALKEKVIKASAKSQREPDHIEIYEVNDSTVLIERIGIMVDIEKELIKNKALEELRLAKRPLEHRIMDAINLEAVISQNIVELFVDWNFEKDKAYMVLILEPENK